MFILYSRLLSRLDSIEQRLAQGEAEPAQDPTPEPDPHIALDHIAELSKNARATWFGLLGLLAFVGVTLLGHKDADFFAWGAETQLPLINVTIPVKSFFIFAPVLVAALYTYLHLYLLNLWDALADAPAQIDGQPLGDRVFPWLITHAALWYRNRSRRQDDGSPEGSTAPRPMGRFVVFVSLSLGAAFGILVLFFLWLRSMPAHDEWLTLWIGLWFFLATLVGLTGLTSAAKRMAGVSREEVTRAHGLRHSWAVVSVFAALAFLSWETTEGGILKRHFHKEDGSVEWGPAIPLYPANLSEAELTRKPPGWLPWHLWREDFEEKFRRRKGIEPGPALTAEQKPEFEEEAKERYAEVIAQLDAPDLLGADLRNADMFRAFLPGADLRGAQMQGANLGGVQMQGADLGGVQMQGADLGGVQMQGADLTSANLSDADLSLANLAGARLDRAKLQGAFLKQVSLRNAALRSANLVGADLFSAQFDGALLGGADFSGANCNLTFFRNAVLHSTKLDCANLSQAQLKGAIGNERTVLPEGLTVLSCFAAPPEGFMEMLAHVEEGNRSKVRSSLLCGAVDPG